VKIYLDTADVESIQPYVSTSLIDGVTTNPTNLAKHSKDPRKTIESICVLLPRGCVSVEVTKKKPEEVYAQAKAITQIAPNILVKIPCYADYYTIIHKLVAEGVRLNITLLFSVPQALMMFKLKVHTISPFVGRLEEIGLDGLGFLTDVCMLRDRYDFKAEVLAASLRTVEQVTGALRAGIDAITVSPNLFAQLITHPLTDKGMEKFETDWQQRGTDIPFP
jgi:transaldolase